MDLRIVHTVGLEMCCVVVCGVGLGRFILFLCSRRSPKFTTPNIIPFFTKRQTNGKQTAVNFQNLHSC